MAERTCSVDGCTAKYMAVGLCNKHYRRFRKTGTFDTTDYRNQSGLQPKAGLKSRICPSCGESYQPYRASQRACSRICYKRLPDVAEANNQRMNTSEARARKSLASRVGTARDPSYQRKLNRKNQLLQKYGLTQVEYQRRIEQQSNLCAICGNTPDSNGKRSASCLNVDHDHETGKIRDLLCSRCNQGIGYFKDDPGLLRIAASYIERHRREI